jgi:hypothetical protein
MATPQSTAAAKVIKALFAATIVYQSVYLYKAIQKNPSPYFQTQPNEESKNTTTSNPQYTSNDNNNNN